MRLLPEIVAERGDGARVELDLRVPDDLLCLAGHFPGMPIVPGVVQVDWSVRLARTKLALQGRFARAENLKFLSVVWPQERLTLAQSVGRHRDVGRGRRGERRTLDGRHDLVVLELRHQAEESARA